jgi:hypothetical protein
MRFSATTFQEPPHVAPDVLLLPSTAPTDQRGNPPVVTRLVTLVGDEIAHLLDRSTDDDLASYVTHDRCFALSNQRFR